MAYTKIEQAAINWAAASGAARNPLSGEASRALVAAIEEKYPGAIARRALIRKRAAFDAKFVGRDIPAWVKRYVAKHGPDVSKVTIRRSRTKTYSSGHCWTWGGEIVVTFGTGSEEEHRMTLLHEIAHTLRPADGHGDRFYAEWRRLLAAEGLYRKAVESGRFGTRRAAKLRRAS